LQQRTKAQSLEQKECDLDSWAEAPDVSAPSQGWV
jgi:hypothetical protein